MSAPKCPGAPAVYSSPALPTAITRKGSHLFRCHSPAYPGHSFNPNTFKLGPGQGGRFHPFSDATGTPVPTLYAAHTFAGACLESVFHDVPNTLGAIYYRAKLKDWHVTEIETTRDLNLIQLDAQTLRRVKRKRGPNSLTAAELLSSLRPCYGNTRSWAAIFHAAHPDAHGLMWNSRLGPSAVMVFFGDRVAPSDFNVLRTEPVADHPWLPLFEKCASAASIQIIH